MPYLPLALTGTEALALAALAGVVALLVWSVFFYRRTRYTLAQVPLYLVCYMLNKLLWRTRVNGPLPVPMDQGAIIVANHRAGVDPLFIAMTTLRPVHWMVA